MLEVHGISFVPPEGFAPRETMLSLAAPAPAPPPPGPEGAPRRFPGVRPNLIAQSRPARPGADLVTLAGEMLAELTRGVGGVVNLSSVPLAFDDGASGMLLAFDFPMPEMGAAHRAKGEGERPPVSLRAPPAAGAGGPPGRGGAAVRQYHALRLDDGRLTTLTLTVGADVTPERGEEYLRALASARKADGKKPAKGRGKKK